MSVSDIPTLNAALNAVATVLILTGFILIRQGRKEAHRKVMLSAALVSALFLVGYVTHKALKGAMAGPGAALHTQFGGTGPIRTVYYVMLLTHVVLAVAIAFLVPRTFAYALQGNLEAHKRWARFTFPIWLYVSVTGVLVYLFLYRWWPAH
jgi:putative membrane protein